MVVVTGPNEIRKSVNISLTWYRLRPADEETGWYDGEVGIVARPVDVPRNFISACFFPDISIIEIHHWCFRRYLFLCAGLGETPWSVGSGPITWFL